MVFTLEIIPLSLYGIVACQLRVTFGIFDSQIDIYGNKIVEQQRIYPFILIFRQYACQIQVCLLYTSPSPRDA